MRNNHYVIRKVGSLQQIHRPLTIWNLDCFVMKQITDEKAEIEKEVEDEGDEEEL